MLVEANDDADEPKGLQRGRRGLIDGQIPHRYSPHQQIPSRHFHYEGGESPCPSMLIVSRRSNLANPDDVTPVDLDVKIRGPPADPPIRNLAFALAKSQLEEAPLEQGRSIRSLPASKRTKKVTYHMGRASVMNRDASHVLSRHHHVFRIGELSPSRA